TSWIQLINCFPFPALPPNPNLVSRFNSLNMPKSLDNTGLSRKQTCLVAGKWNIKKVFSHSLTRLAKKVSAKRVLSSSLSCSRPSKIEVSEMFIHNRGGSFNPRMAAPKMYVGFMREEVNVLLFFSVNLHWILCPERLIKVSLPSNTDIHSPNCSPSQST